MTVRRTKKKPASKSKVAPKKSKSEKEKTSSLRIPKENDVKMSEMVDLAAEMFVRALEVSTRIPPKLRNELLKAVKHSAKEILS
ncbi:hypothetical protein CH373_13135 [Leptospira perolatii]|uniref:Uncharacterized protein n=2 Tax=Leptospira perolatii TaxID=2023191 RepID=A0A2M9ZKY9_9LEPT|nr:hypothetical protein CH360_08550 [Leptospira perolatii]PJZ72736.1 hypothetical protein CH373_13135 [Leptospira perolatii]